MAEEAVQQSNVLAVLPRPKTHDRAGWRAFWQAQGQEWRTEPEIDDKRQRSLLAMIKTAPPDDPDIYPFLYQKLARADIEWMIANPPSDVGKALDSLVKAYANKFVKKDNL